MTWLANRADNTVRVVNADKDSFATRKTTDSSGIKQHMFIGLGIAIIAMGSLGCGASESAMGSDDGVNPSNGMSPSGGIDPEGPIEIPESANYMIPFTAHSGFGGTAVYKTPFSTDLTGDLTWSISDPAVGSIVSAPTPIQFSEFGESWGILTTAGIGTATVTVTNGIDTAESTIIVTGYAPAQAAIGMQRYNEPANPGENRPACASCHQAADGADHSPLISAFYNDADLLTLIKTGMSPIWNIPNTPHAFDVAPDEEIGIIAYLRSLPPTGF